MMNKPSSGCLPIDTSAVSLSSEMHRLIPLLARNTHAVWQRQRETEGWRYGPQRDDDMKHHPGLIEYDALSESEREYDCAVVTEVLKVLVALGYRVEKS
jgi:RyR domain